MSCGACIRRLPPRNLIYQRFVGNQPWKNYAGTCTLLADIGFYYSRFQPTSTKSYFFHACRTRHLFGGSNKSLANLRPLDISCVSATYVLLILQYYKWNTFRYVRFHSTLSFQASLCSICEHNRLCYESGGFWSPFTCSEFRIWAKRLRIIVPLQPPSERGGCK